MRIAWVTGRDYADADADLPLLQDAARAAEVDSRIEVWDDPAVDWDRYDIAVVRSCWDYVPRREEFLAWARTVPRLANPAQTIAWNTDKVYLRDLTDAGIDVVTTRWSVRSTADLPEADEWVVKPTVSAGSADTARWSDPEQAVAHSVRLLDQGRATMTQPYVASVDSDGETGILFFRGKLSHAFRKGALLVTDDDPRTLPELKEDIGPREPNAAQAAFGARVVDVITRRTGAVPLYARVDVVSAADGSPRLMEAELAEPSLFLVVADGAAGRFVQATIDHAHSLGRGD